MKLGTEVDVLERIKQASGARSDQELARKLGLSKQSIAKARTTKSVPSSWIPKAAILFNTATDWLFFGNGPMRPPQGDPVLADGSPGSSPPISGPQFHTCPHCAGLEAQLEAERRECREQRRELRELHLENRFLLKENGKLREELATLREWRNWAERMQKSPL